MLYNFAVHNQSVIVSRDGNDCNYVFLSRVTMAMVKKEIRKLKLAGERGIHNWQQTKEQV